MSASVIVIAGEDGRPIWKELKTSLKSSTAEHINTVEEYLIHSKTDSGKVVVVVLTSLIWQEIDGLRNHDIIKLFGCPGCTIVIFGNTKIRETAIEKLSRIVERWHDIISFDCDRVQLIDAEAQIKRILVGMSNKEIYSSSATRYIIKPRVISSLSKENSNAFIILLEDEHYNLKQVGSVTVKAHGKYGTIRTQKIQSNIWSFNVAGLDPGRHDVDVYVDDKNFGSYKIKVESSLDIAKAAMRKELNDNGPKILANILKIEENSLDYDLTDIFNDSSHKKYLLNFIEGLLQFGENDKDQHASALLNFCKKFELRQFSELLDNDKASDSSSVDSPEVFTQVKSPFDNMVKRPHGKDNFAKNTTDSGISLFGGSRGSIDIPKVAPIRLSKAHYYEEIDDEQFHKYTDDNIRSSRRLSEVATSSIRPESVAVEANRISHKQTNLVSSTRM